MSDLPPRQRTVHDRLLDHVQRTGETPDLSDFARGLGMHYVTLKQHLEALHRKGYVVFESRGRGRSPSLRLPHAATGVPLLGSIPAGPLGLAAVEPEGFLALPGMGRDQFALRVDGLSMADLMQPGDVVLLERRPPRRSGEICAVRVEDDDVTLKYVDGVGTPRLVLRAHNADFPDRAVPAANVQVDGVYRGLLRGDVADALLESDD
ncbi:MAG: LexA family transcriptional regulator [Trueperaceae bacterium]|nr:LexA family transcriptional regulator [Trueperaceae bacterium]